MAAPSAFRTSAGIARGVRHVDRRRKCALVAESRYLARLADAEVGEHPFAPRSSK
ncbi:hypothetical protein [Paraburkholderia mimosarum]|uniref:hypothetical protein n=1 Tax=Paraburkholderia mimosarum TaxID=312026 RepID=UPI00040B3463|nr:hypothetical protein [Paraburkholderia mimosarum]